MSAPVTLSIPASEHGVVRVFLVDLPAGDLAGFNRQNGSWPLREALGAEVLRADRIEFFDVSDLGEMTLSSYLRDGQGVPQTELDPLRARLDALRGHVLVLPSSAFGGVAQELRVHAPLRLIATLNEDRPAVQFARLPGGGAEGNMAPPAPCQKKLHMPPKWLTMMLSVAIATALALIMVRSK